MLITHPTQELITPADLLDRARDQTAGTLPIPDALDLEHSAHLTFSGSLPAPVHHNGDERSADQLLISR